MFIRDVAQRLLSKVNSEARDLTHASELFTGYLTEFCDEYDRCGYGSTGSSKP